MRKLGTAFAVLTALGACMDTEGDRAAAPTVETGRAAFMEDCAACHGEDARGGGPMATDLRDLPPDLTRIAARHGGTFPRDYVMSVIDGYARGEHFSPAMPEFGAGDMGPIIIVEEVEGLGTPVPTRLLALAEYLEAVQR